MWWKVSTERWAVEWESVLREERILSGPSAEPSRVFEAFLKNRKSVFSWKYTRVTVRERKKTYCASRSKKFENCFWSEWWTVQNIRSVHKRPERARSCLNVFPCKPLYFVWVPFWERSESETERWAVELSSVLRILVTLFDPSAEPSREFRAFLKEKARFVRHTH